MSASKVDLLAEAGKYVLSLCPLAPQPNVESTLAAFERTNESQGKSFAIALQTFIQRQVLPQLDCAVPKTDGKKIARLEEKGVAIPATQTTHNDHTYHVYDGGRGGDDTRIADQLANMQRAIAAAMGAVPAAPADPGVRRDDDRHRGTLAHAMRKAVLRNDEARDLFREIDVRFPVGGNTDPRERARELRALMFYVEPASAPEFAVAMRMAENLSTDDALFKREFTRWYGTREPATTGNVLRQRQAYNEAAVKIRAYRDALGAPRTPAMQRADETVNVNMNQWLDDIQRVPLGEMQTKLDEAEGWEYLQQKNRAASLRRQHPEYSGVINEWERQMLQRRQQDYVDTLTNLMDDERTPKQKKEKATQIKVAMRAAKMPVTTELSELLEYFKVLPAEDASDDTTHAAVTRLIERMQDPALVNTSPIVRAALMKALQAKETEENKKVIDHWFQAQRLSLHADAREKLGKINKALPAGEDAQANERINRRAIVDGIIADMAPYATSPEQFEATHELLKAVEKRLKPPGRAWGIPAFLRRTPVAAGATPAVAEASAARDPTVGGSAPSERSGVDTGTSQEDDEDDDDDGDDDGDGDGDDDGNGNGNGNGNGDSDDDGDGDGPSGGGGGPSGTAGGADTPRSTPNTGDTADTSRGTVGGADTPQSSADPFGPGTSPVLGGGGAEARGARRSPSGITEDVVSTLTARLAEVEQRLRDFQNATAAPAAPAAAPDRRASGRSYGLPRSFDNSESSAEVRAAEAETAELAARLQELRSFPSVPSGNMMSRLQNRIVQLEDELLRARGAGTPDTAALRAQIQQEQNEVARLKAELTAVGGGADPRVAALSLDLQRAQTNEQHMRTELNHLQQKAERDLGQYDRTVTGLQQELATERANAGGNVHRIQAIQRDLEKALAGEKAARAQVEDTRKRAEKELADAQADYQALLTRESKLSEMTGAERREHGRLMEEALRRMNEAGKDVKDAEGRAERRNASAERRVNNAQTEADLRVASAEAKLGPLQDQYDQAARFAEQARQALRQEQERHQQTQDTSAINLTQAQQSVAALQEQINKLTQQNAAPATDGTASREVLEARQREDDAVKRLKTVEEELRALKNATAAAAAAPAAAPEAAPAAAPEAAAAPVTPAAAPVAPTAAPVAPTAAPVAPTAAPVAPAAAPAAPTAAPATTATVSGTKRPSYDDINTSDAVGLTATGVISPEELQRARDLHPAHSATGTGTAGSDAGSNGQEEVSRPEQAVNYLDLHGKRQRVTEADTMHYSQEAPEPQSPVAAPQPSGLDQPQAPSQPPAAVPQTTAERAQPRASDQAQQQPAEPAQPAAVAPQTTKPAQPQPAQPPAAAPQTTDPAQPPAATQQPLGPEQPGMSWGQQPQQSVSQGGSIAGLFHELAPDVTGGDDMYNQAADINAALTKAPAAAQTVDAYADDFADSLLMTSEGDGEGANPGTAATPLAYGLADTDLESGDDSNYSPSARSQAGYESENVVMADEGSATDHEEPEMPDAGGDLQNDAPGPSVEVDMTEPGPSEPVEVDMTEPVQLPGKTRAKTKKAKKTIRVANVEEAKLTKEPMTRGQKHLFAEAEKARKLLEMEKRREAAVQKLRPRTSRQALVERVVERVLREFPAEDQRPSAFNGPF